MIQKRSRITFVLGALFLLSLLLLLLAEQRGVKENTSWAPEQSLIGEVDLSTTHKIHLIGSFGSFAVERQGSLSGPPSWRLKKPDGAPGDAKVISELLDTLAELTPSAVIEEAERDQELGGYGLEPPEQVVIIEGEFGKKVLSFGAKNEVSGRRYLQLEQDSRIYLVEETIFERIIRGIPAVQSKTPLAFSLENIQAVSVVQSERGAGYSLEQAPCETGKKRNWSVNVEGKRLPGNNEGIERELIELTQTEVKAVIDGIAAALPLYGLDRPAVILRIVLAPTEPATTPTEFCEIAQTTREVIVHVGKGIGVEVAPESDGALRKTQAYYLRVAGETWGYEIDRGFLGDWLQPAEHFLDRAPFKQIKSEEVSTIELESAGNTRTIFKAQDSGAFAALFNTLQGTEILTYFGRADIPGDDTKLGFYAPKLIVRLKGNDQQERAVLYVGSSLQGPQGATESERKDAPHYARLAVGSGEPLTGVLSGLVIPRFEDAQGSSKGAP